MFKKAERLNRTTFTQYFKIGRRYHTDNFTLIYSPAPFKAVAVVVGKKVYKGAVDRNTLRRRVYGATKVIFDEIANPSGAYLIIAKPTAKNISQSGIVPEITQLLATATKAR